MQPHPPVNTAIAALPPSFRDSLSEKDRKILAYGQSVPRYTSFPTAPHFHAGIGHEETTRWLMELRDETGTEEGFSLYFHIPYCEQICWYCGCNTQATRKYGPIEDYLDILLREIRQTSDIVGFRGKARQIHFGGGSPSLLRAEDMARILETVGECFEIGQETEIAIEIDPRTVDKTKINAYAAMGVNRASLGVQDFAPEVMAAINRQQPFSMVQNAYEWLVASGISGINMDLIYGLPYQNPTRFADTLEQCLTLSPSRFAVFGYAHVPWMKKHMRLIPEESLPNPTERLQLFRLAESLLTARGYAAVGIDHFALPHDAMAVALKEKRLARNFQGYTTDEATILLGFGASSISGLPQGYVQNQTQVPAYREAVFSGQPAAIKGYRLTDEDRLRRRIINELMCYLEADIGAICEEEGYAAYYLDEILGSLGRYHADGLITLQMRRLRIAEDARPFTRIICAAFDPYLAQGKARHSQAV
jgi:oxygen-independent coproporphyrinogen-3 oxidase